MNKLLNYFKKLNYKKILIYSFALFLFLILLDFLFPFQYNLSYSTEIQDDNGKTIHVFLSEDDKWRLKANLDEINPKLVETLLQKEDKYFYWHPGINVFAIAKALVYNVFTLRRNSGASTITMQVVRMLKPRPRTYFSKIKEIINSFQLEWHLSKTEILEIYLNLLPYGNNIEGVKAASSIFFQQKTQNLSWSQMALLSIIHNRPTSLNPKNAVALKNARNQWILRWKNENYIPENEAQIAIHEDITIKKTSFPKNASHLSLRLKNQFPNQTIIQSSINSNFQEKMELMVKNYIEAKKGAGISNAAVLVLDNETHKVKAYLGSADFSSKEDLGQNDGVTAIRSPGSTLKPILFGLGFDKGLITPKLKVLDVPTNYKGYSPKNYDEKFKGQITASEALAFSLNIPSIRLMHDLGWEEVVQFYADNGYQKIQSDKEKLGLSMILGGCGVNLEELTQFYSTFANEGVFNSLSYLKNDTSKISKKVFSPEANYMVHTILTQLTRPDFPNNFQDTKNLSKIAWKTGTSFGLRDAWAIGFNKKYTIGVWIGNFDGHGSNELIGANIATPLLFELFSLVSKGDKNWFEQPKNLASRKVCAITGKIPAEFCENLIEDYYIPLISHSTVCTHKKKIWVNTSETMSYCSHCVPDHGVFQKYYDDINSELAYFWMKEKKSFAKKPPHNPNCKKDVSENNLMILNPSQNGEYMVDLLNKRKMALECTASHDSEEISWFLDGKFITKVKPGENHFFVPDTGWHEAVCRDNKGRKDKVKFHISGF